MSGTKGVTGYRELSKGDINDINEIKAMEAKVAELYLILKDAAPNTTEQMRQLALARTHLEQGFMHLVRSIALPVTNWEV